MNLHEHLPALLDNYYDFSSNADRARACACAVATHRIGHRPITSPLRIGGDGNPSYVRSGAPAAVRATGADREATVPTLIGEVLRALLYCVGAVRSRRRGRHWRSRRHGRRRRRCRRRWRSRWRWCRARPRRGCRGIR